MIKLTATHSEETLTLIVNEMDEPNTYSYRVDFPHVTVCQGVDLHLGKSKDADEVRALEVLVSFLEWGNPIESYPTGWTEELAQQWGDLIHCAFGEYLCRPEGVGDDPLIYIWHNETGYWWDIFKPGGDDPDWSEGPFETAFEAYDDAK